MTRSDVDGDADRSDPHPAATQAVGLPQGGRAAAPGPRRLHPLSPLLDLVDRNLLAPGALALGSGGVRILAGALVVVGLFRVLAWSRRTYLLHDGVLRVTSGILSRNEQLVPCDRVQQVNLVQKLRHRLVGVASLRVEVAGGGRGSGATLDVLGLADASALRDALLAAKAEVGSGRGEGPLATSSGDAPAEAPQWVPAAWPVARLSSRQLVLVGLTGSELLVLFAFAVSGLQLLGDAPGLIPSDGGVEVGALPPLAVGLLVIAFVVVWLGSAAATSVFRDAGYALDLVGDELHLRRGLLDRREAVLPLARVQAVQLTANPLRRALGVTSVRVQSAGSGTDQEDRRVSIPLLSLSDAPSVLERLLPGAAATPPLERAPAVARRRAIVRASWPVAAVVTVIAALTAPVGLAALLLIPVAAGFGELSYRAMGFATGPSHLMTRSGAIVRRTVVVPLVRGQSVRVRSSPLQRRLGLATCIVDIAGPGRRPTVRDVRTETAEAVQVRVVEAIGGR